MKEVWRARVTSSSKTNVASRVKICRSGQNRTRVPVTPFSDPGALAGQAERGVERRGRPVAGEDAGVAALEGHAADGRGPLDVHVQAGRERVDDRGADAVQAAGGDVRAAAELAAGVQLGEDHLDAGQPGLGLLVDRDAAAVVVDLDRAVGVQGDLDAVGRAGQRLVDAVVDDLPHAVHEAAGVGRADVHARALAHRLEALQDQQVPGVVGVVDGGSSGGWRGWHGAPVWAARDGWTHPADVPRRVPAATARAGFATPSARRTGRRGPGGRTAGTTVTSRCGNELCQVWRIGHQKPPSHVRLESEPADVRAVWERSPGPPGGSFRRWEASAVSQCCAR